MVYLATPSDDGRAVYFELYATERTATGLRVCATIGDGQYEGEVLVEFSGSCQEVTFADSWLGGTGFREFATRCNIRQFGQELLASLKSAADCQVRHDLPNAGYNGAYSFHSWVRENRGLWQGAA